MKKISIAILLAIVINPLFAQNLLDIYKSGSVKLVPEADYGKGNDWNKVFETYYDTIYNKPMGNRKSLKLLPDGSIVVNHEYRDFYSLFSPMGEFKKEFSLKSKPGVPQKHVYKIAGVINSNTFYSSLDNLGNMLCFDFEGNFKKKLKLDYMTRQMIALPNNRIAVVGWVLWEKKTREFVSIVDYNTNEQHDIWERFADRKYPENAYARPMFNYSYRFPSGGMVSYSTMPFAKRSGFGPPPKIASIGNQLIIAVPSTGEIFTYDINGNQLTKDQIGWAKNYISVEEQREIQRKAIEKYRDQDLTSHPQFDPDNERMVKHAERHKNAMDEIIPLMEEDLKNISKPIPKPMFSTIIKDSDENLLFFEYPAEEGQNKFNVWVYKDDRTFVCQSSFQSDDYELQINPAKLVFHNGYVYGLQVLKNSSGVPLRLVKFKLEKGNDI